MIPDKILDPRNGVENDARSATRPKEWGSRMMADKILDPRNGGRK